MLFNTIIVIDQVQSTLFLAPEPAIFGVVSTGCYVLGIIYRKERAVSKTDIVEMRSFKSTF